MRKFVTYAVVAITLVWSLGLAAVVPASAAYTPTAGDLVKTANDSAVYYINADGNRSLFVNAVTFWTWYSGDWGNIMFGNDSKTIETISQEDFDALDIGSNVTVRPGSKLIKFQNSPKVYAVTPGAELRAVVGSDGDDTVAKTLYGDDYTVITIQNGFEGNYTKGEDLNTTSDLPDGSLIKYEGSEDIYYIEDGLKRIVEDDAFLANAFMDSSVVTVPTSMSYSNGASITEKEAGLTTIAGSATSTPVVGGAITVSLSSMTPATKVLLENQALASVLVFDLVNSSANDATIDSFVIERGGLATDVTSMTISAFENSVTGTQIGNNKSLNSDHRATFTDDVVVKAGTTKQIVVAVNLPSDLSSYASDAPKFGLYSLTMKSGSANASLPIWGNMMQYNYNVVIATATVAAGGNNPTSDIAPKVGDKDVDLTQIKITNGSATEEMQVEKVVFKQAGTVADSDITSYKLIDTSNNTVLATASQVDKNITFVLSTPLNIGKSKNVSLMVKAAEIYSGSSRTIQLDIYKNTDVLVKGLSYNAYVIPTFPASSQPYFDMAVSQTIGNGTVKIEASNDFNAANISEGTDGVQIGEWLFTVKGESVDITQISALIATSSGISTSAADYTDITSGVFFDVDSGATLSGGIDASSAKTITSTDTITLGVGVHKIGLKVNLSSDFENNDTLQANMTADNLTITGNTTGNDISATGGVQTSSIQTIKTAKMSVSVSINPPAQTIIRGDTVTAANIVLDASASGDDLSINQLKTVVHTTNMSPDEISNITLWDGATQLLTTSDPIPTSSTANASVTTTWYLASTLKVTAGTVKTLTVKTTTAGSTQANDSFAVGFQSGCTVTTKDSEGEDVTPTYTYSDGQTMTIQTTGTVTITRSDEYSSGMLAGNSNGLAVGKFTANAKYGDVDLEKMYVTVTDENGGGTDELRGIYLYDGSTLVATATITSSNQAAVLFNMESNPLTISVNSTKELTVKVDTGVIANDGTATNATANTGFIFSIASTDVTAKTNGSTATITGSTLTFPTYRMLKSVPTVVVASSGASLTGNSTYDLIDVTVSADAKGPVGLYKMTFEVATTTVEVASYQVYEGGTLVATEATDGISTYYKDDGSGSEVVEVYFNLGGALGGRLREVAAGSSKTYTLRASVTGYTSNVSNSVSVAIAGDDEDDATTYYAGASAIDALSDADFIWSDLSYGNTSTTATTTAQWLNGFEIDSSGGLLGTTSSPKSI